MNANDSPLTLPPSPAPAPVEEVALYEIRKKIYPRAVHGWFATWRWALVFATQLVFYGLPWLTWNGRQAVLFDIAARKFYIFGLVLWPQDVIYLDGRSWSSPRYSLFLFTAIAGRLWCGYACPQTVYTEIFLWIERKIEGDRVARMTPRRQRRCRCEKFVHQGGQAHGMARARAVDRLHVRRLFLADPRPRHPRDHVAASAPWEAFWILFYGFATYGNAGFMREQVCKYMCPYARFQSVMFDRDTLIITYDRERGEPRGARSRKADPKTSGPRATASTATSACRCARPASTSARGCSTNASAAPPASTAATR